MEFSDKIGTVIGYVTIATQYISNEVSEMPKPLVDIGVKTTDYSYVVQKVHPKPEIKLIIWNAKFNKDCADWISKQDPYVQFKYGGKTLRTKTKWNAGKVALWNEEFTLENIDSEIASGNKFRF